MSVPAYPAYKDSGVEWLPWLPQHWSVSTIKATSYLKGRVGWKGLTSAEFREEAFAYLVTGTDFQSKYIKWSSCYQVEEDRYEDDPFIKLTEGDLLITKDGTIGKLAVVGHMDKPACLNSGVFLLRSTGAWRTEFMYWVLASPLFSHFVDLTSYGSTINHLYQNVFERFAFPVPPPAEQAAIATFLDRETGKIDALVEEQRRLIALLKEKRQAVISHAVTKGLNPQAPLKPSGIEWPTHIPEQWSVLPLTRLVRQFVDYRGATPTKVDDGVPLITATQIKRGRIDHSLDPVYISEEEYATRMTRGFPARGDLLLTTEAPLGEVALVEEERIAPGQRIILMKVETDRVTSAFLLTHFQSEFGTRELWMRASGSTASGIRADRLRASLVLVPPVQEQRAIVEHVAAVTSTFEDIEREANIQITLLQERRAALISAAVTGKIDVRGLVATPGALEAA